jgi:GNAT superfamily N-acetyltransferase
MWFELSDDVDRLDRAVIHRWLSEQSYWAAGRSRERQDAAIDASWNVGAYGVDGKQIGFARVVTDGVAFAWISDVFVAEEARGAGIGRAMVARLLERLDAAEVRRSMLRTSDAHGVYTALGFAGIDKPDDWMARIRPTL